MGIGRATLDLISLKFDGINPLFYGIGEAVDNDF